MTPETIRRPIAVKTHFPKPRPMAKEPIAISAAPPAPTGAITLPIQLMRFRNVPSGWVPCWPWTATLTCGAVPRFLCHQPGLHNQHKPGQYNGDSQFLPPNVHVLHL